MDEAQEGEQAAKTRGRIEAAPLGHFIIAPAGLYKWSATAAKCRRAFDRCAAADEDL